MDNIFYLFGLFTFYIYFYIYKIQTLNQKTLKKHFPDIYKEF